MIKLQEFFYDIDEDSEASKEAKRRGLISGGWGWWKDTQGRTVAQTVGGKLVFTNYPRPTKPKPHVSNRHRSRQLTKPQSQQDYWKNARPNRELRNRAYSNYLTPEQLNEYFREDNFYTWEPENGHHYFLAAANRMREMFKRLQNNKMYSDRDRREEVVGSLVRDIFEILNVSPVYNIKIDDLDCDMIHKVTGTSVLGLHKAGSQTIGLSKETVDRLYQFAQTTEADWRAFESKYDRIRNYDNTTEYDSYRKMYDAIETVIHESVHAKDKFVNTDWAHSSTDTFIYEGLTENKARELTNDLFNKKTKVENRRGYTKFGSYQNEVSRLEELEAMRPGILDKLWKTQDPNQRQEIIYDTVFTCADRFWKTYMPMTRLPNAKRTMEEVMKKYQSIESKIGIFKMWQYGMFDGIWNRYGFFHTGSAQDERNISIFKDMLPFWDRRLEHLKHVEQEL